MLAVIIIGSVVTTVTAILSSVTIIGRGRGGRGLQDNILRDAGGMGSDSYGGSYSMAVIIQKR